MLVAATEPADPVPSTRRRRAVVPHAAASPTRSTRSRPRRRSASSRGRATSTSSPGSPRRTAGRCTSTTRWSRRGYVLRFQFLIQDYRRRVTLKWGELADRLHAEDHDRRPGRRASRRGSGSPASAWSSSSCWAGTSTARRFDLQIYPGFGEHRRARRRGAKAQSVLAIDAVGAGDGPKKILGELLPRLNNRLTGSGSTIGDPASRPGEVIDSTGWATSSAACTASRRPRTRSTAAATARRSTRARRSGSVRSRCRRASAARCACRDRRSG